MRENEKVDAIALKKEQVHNGDERDLSGNKESYNFGNIYTLFL